MQVNHHHVGLQSYITSGYPKEDKTDIPYSYSKVVSLADLIKWVKAMEFEFCSLTDVRTGKLVRLSHN